MSDQTLSEYLRTHPYKGPVGKDFTPVIIWNPDGRFLEVFFTDEPAWSEVANEYLSILRAFDTNVIVGCKLYGVGRMIESSKSEAFRKRNDG